MSFGGAAGEGGVFVGGNRGGCEQHTLSAWKLQTPNVLKISYEVDGSTIVLTWCCFYAIRVFRKTFCGKVLSFR